MTNKDELLAKANKPAELAMRLHPYYRGKMQTLPRACVRSLDDFSIWYTPGVAEPCKAINKDKDLVYEYTSKWNTVAVVSDGTRVLGLGDIGPEAGLPVMEGKSLLFKYLGGVDAVPICLDTKDPEEIIRTVRILQPSFGGINLEDISQPKCFPILERLRQEMEIPVWHDDQQGTAAVILAGVLNGLHIVGKKIGQVSIALIGAGAANIRTASLLMAAGADPGRIYMTDSKGILNRQRTELQGSHPEKWEMCQKTNTEGRQGGIAEAMRGADVTIALSQSGPGVIKKEWVSGMAKDAILFACANPVPEIWPWEAKEGGARVVGTGRSDFPNQVNNSLGFPAIFRGALDVRARTITDQMCLAGTEELAACGRERPDFGEEHLLPTMEDWEVYARVAAAVGTKAVEQGVARKVVKRSVLQETARRMILEARRATALLMESGIIPPAPEE